jgi:hypothetical protein
MLAWLFSGDVIYIGGRSGSGLISKLSKFSSNGTLKINK